MNKFSIKRRFFAISTNGYIESCPWERRLMTTSRRVQDRSRNMRVHDLEIVTEKWKIISKVLFIMEVLRKEPQEVIPVRELEQYRRQINLQKPHSTADFLRKSPKLFELYKDQKKVTWCGLTREAEELVDEEIKILEEHSDKAAEYVTRFLMMTVDKQLAVDKIAHFRREFGLPYDFRGRWIRKYPELFRVVRSGGVDYLKLVSWNPGWAVTELERKSNRDWDSDLDHFTPGVLSLPFPLKFPETYRRIFKYAGKIAHFQARSYLSPYADARELKPGSLEFVKRAIAVMHELLTFTIEKRLVTDHLTHFRQELVMPQKLMRIFLKHIGIFYVSERGKRFSVFLTEAYEGSELIEKCPIVLWKEKVQRLIGYRGKKKKLETFNEFSDMEGDNNLIERNGGGENVVTEIEDEQAMGDLEDGTFTDDSEMEVGEFILHYVVSLFNCSACSLKVSPVPFFPEVIDGCRKSNPYNFGNVRVLNPYSPVNFFTPPMEGWKEKIVIRKNHERRSKGLAYLYEFYTKKCIHGESNWNNVLRGNVTEPLIWDFGLERLVTMAGRSPEL
ncbi:hypothetical protein GIB67_040787 [Kingdonia uniflora]|uniref:PORR domain-containing protein n=1 Tax=Kingdonia uniflora TaxID=39325 RepID=A0A7J7P589_9MAGN|nr:hypothetical protein GIB67_040787 [Kingdonia uniflora]